MKKILLLIVLISIKALSQDFEIISHRGGALLAPENTLSAFENSVQIGAHYYELDVRMSSDDSLIIMHDGTIDRTTNGVGNVSSLTFDQLRVFDAGSWFSSEFEGEKIPLLSEALEVAKNASTEIGVVIEIKSTEDNIVDKVVELVKKMNMEDQVIISSFNFTQVVKAKSLASNIKVQLFAGAITETMISNMSTINGEWVGSGSNLSESLISLAHTNNVKVNRWTLNGATQIQEIIANGYDAVTTDDPIVAFSVLDSTAPSSVTLNQPVVISTKVKLSWTEAIDSESGIAYYEIYRSSSPGASDSLITVKDELTYIDETLRENETFYYRIRAVNYAGLYSESFSNEVMATTGADLNAPKVQVVSAYGISNKVIIEFNERLENVSAETAVNYGINNNISVNEAELLLDSSSVILTVDEMTNETEYIISVVNITDLANSENTIEDTLFFNFTYKSYLSDIAGAWDLDEGTGTTLIDLSGNANDGTAFNGLAWGSGYTGNGIEFDGIDDYAEIPASTSLDIIGDAVTVSLWTKLAYLPADLPGGYGPLYDSDTDNYVLYEDKGNNELRFKVATSSGAERPGIPATQLKADEWIHVVGVYDGANAMIYLNGEMMDSHALTGTVNTGQVAKIGQSSGSFFKGSIDNIQVFAKALTEEEINFLHAEFYSSFIDITPPEIIGTTSLGANNKIFITFTEELEQLSAENVDNYSIDNGITVNSAQLSVDGKSVILDCSEMVENVIYTVAVNGINDLADIPNIIAENTEIVLTHKSFPEGLISYWSFDEGIDSIANDWTGTNTGLIKNSPEWTAGQTGNSLKFDGIDDYVEVANSPSLDIDTNGVTVSLWVLLDFLPADMPFNIGPIYDSGTDNYVIYQDKGNNELRFKVSTTGGAERPGIPADTLTTGLWHHVAGVYNGTEAKIFFDGELMDVHNLTGNVKPGQVARIGQDGTSYFSGNIDNVQIYNRGLTDQEVQFLFSGQKTSTINVKNIDETIVNLEWNDVHDPLLGISGYNVYRDTTEMPTQLLTLVKDTTGYSDQTRQELTTFYYRIKAVNASGNESEYFSNEIMATTEEDLTAPQVVTVRTSGESDKVYVNFGEKLDETSATEATNYSIAGVTINEAAISVDNKNVILTVSGMTENESYALTMNNLKDIAAAENTIAENTQQEFVYTPFLDGLISYWKLEEVDDTTAIDIIGTNNGSIANNPLSVDGILGNALFFDGTDDYVEIPNSTSLDIGTDGVTVSVWVNLKYLPKEMPTSIGPIYDAPQDSYVIYEDKWNRELRFKVSTENGAERPGIPNDDLVKGEWLHIVGVYDGAQALIYLNGVKKDSHPGLTGTVKADQVARIGQDGSHYFNGAIDNLQIFNRGLTPEEITSLYTGDIVTDIIESELLPTKYSLEQNYPNPFNPSTKIRFSLPERSEVTLEIYNVIGERVSELLHGTLNVGHHEIEFRNSNLSSGIYFYRLNAGNFSEVKKMILLK